MSNLEHDFKCMAEIEKLGTWILESKRIVFFGGAGISTESGIPDFRSAAGIYHQENKLSYSPEEILSRPFFNRHPEVFYDFYRTKMLHPEARPNPAHQLLAALEKAGRLKAIVTQNIDGLHQMAGSQNVLELHGSIHRNYCMSCHEFYTLDQVMQGPAPVPLCMACQGVIKPDVVLYGENLNEDTMERSIRAIAEADLLLIGGTSLTVQPAAHLVTYYQGGRTVLLNASSTPYDSRADLLITDPIGAVMDTLKTVVL